MSAGDSNGACLGVHAFIKRRPNSEDTSARPPLRFEDHDRQAGSAEQVSGAHSRKAGSHDHGRIAGDRPCAGADRECGKRSSPRGLLEKAPPVHGALWPGLRTAK